MYELLPRRLLQLLVHDPNDADGRPSDEDLSEDLGDDGWPDDDDGVAGARPQA